MVMHFWKTMETNEMEISNFTMACLFENEQMDWYPICGDFTYETTKDSAKQRLMEHYNLINL